MNKEDKDLGGKAMQINVRVPEEVGRGVYANLVSVNAGPNEVILDFVLAVPNTPEGTLTSRVIVSPNTAQQLSDLLEALMREGRKNKSS